MPWSEQVKHGVVQDEIALTLASLVLVWVLFI